MLVHILMFDYPKIKKKSYSREDFELLSLRRVFTATVRNKMIHIRLLTANDGSRKGKHVLVFCMPLIRTRLTKFKYMFWRDIASYTPCIYSSFTRMFVIVVIQLLLQANVKDCSNVLQLCIFLPWSRHRTTIQRLLCLFLTSVCCHTSMNRKYRTYVYNIFAKCSIKICYKQFIHTF